MDERKLYTQFVRNGSHTAILMSDQNVNVGRNCVPLRTTCIRTDYDTVLPIRNVPFDVRDHQGLREEVVYGEVKEALDLAGVQVHGNDMVTSCDSKHVRNKLGSNRSPRLVLFVHSCIRVAWDDGRNTSRRGALASRDDDEEFHQVVVHIVAPGLDDEDVLFSNGLGDLDVYLAIGEFFDSAGCQGHIEPAGQVIR